MEESTELQTTVINTIVAVILFAALFFFASSSGKGLAIKEQILAKEISLFIDAAKPGTEISIEKDFNSTITLENNKVNVKVLSGTAGYDYGFFSPYNIEIETNENEVKIKVKWKNQIFLVF